MANSLFRYHVTNHGFLTWMIFAPLWRRIKNKWDGLQTIITKWKRNKNLKMQSFCPAINCSNRADRGKNKSNYRFPSTVKNNDKEGLKLSKVRREKWLAQIFREDLTQRKLKKNKNQSNVLCLRFIDFFTKSSLYQIWKANTYSILTNSNQTWTASVEVFD